MGVSRWAADRRSASWAQTSLQCRCCALRVPLLLSSTAMRCSLSLPHFALSSLHPGFPMRDDLQDGGPFEVHPGRGLLGGDIVCNETLVPGRCVLASIGRATLICGTRPDCGAVVYFADGAFLWSCCRMGGHAY